MRSYLLSMSIFIALASAIIGGYFILSSVTPEDEQAYWKVIAESDPAFSDSSETPYTAKQQRQNSHKHLWMDSSGESLQLCVKSEEAELVLVRHDESTEVIENMRHVQCSMK